MKTAMARRRPRTTRRQRAPPPPTQTCADSPAGSVLGAARAASPRERAGPEPNPDPCALLLWRPPPGSWRALAHAPHACTPRPSSCAGRRFRPGFVQLRRRGRPDGWGHAGPRNVPAGQSPRNVPPARVPSRHRPADERGPSFPRLFLRPRAGTDDGAESDESADLVSEDDMSVAALHEILSSEDSVRKKRRVGAA